MTALLRSALQLPQRCALVLTIPAATPKAAATSRRRSFSAASGGALQTTSALLAAKAKKGAAKAKAGAGPAIPSGPKGADQLFNIFAEREDDKIEKDEAYPQWLFELDKPPKNYGELSMMFVHGIGIEDATLPDYQRFLRQHRKLVIKINNLRLKKSKRRASFKIA
mmetsp:Transcript_72651/g.151656  ORF Transcript_72651/g.151656 Transcript_72651/m.151656 type:complete len:166 (+) Transcript_72651:42-539(+)|eukprot:CAMPEP_0206470924 /NCGR_PEP_ID=MMETSP0324_2-20121206/31240_1 /ASSEMBLY_ACC=CAM_ASM_000836 /TAXON_ID=2866 /ORGANISM="Crypthecodinium cohnii, Strain Seligo" /LENGTH=165 /DNA_ID=CAMNT_0053945117 /DNA_START=47 /DNA_END=544 /DNA_ORIENTATION=+